VAARTGGLPCGIGNLARTRDAARLAARVGVVRVARPRSPSIARSGPWWRGRSP